MEKSEEKSLYKNYIFSDDAIPSARSRSTAWVTNQGSDTEPRFWIFGGLSSAPYSYYADLWEYRRDNNQWRYVIGSQYIQQTSTIFEDKKMFHDLP